MNKKDNTNKISILSWYHQKIINYKDINDQIPLFGEF